MLASSPTGLTETLPRLFRSMTLKPGIRAADICFAEITTDNPNVWYELGYAIAAGKPVILACTDERARFPFDIQHRRVIRYKTESTSDFEVVKLAITTQMEAALERRATMEQAAGEPLVAPQAGLSPQQLSALVSIAQRTGDSGDAVSIYELRHEMSNVGFTDIATTLGVRGLMRDGLVESFPNEDRNGNEYMAYRATDAGLNWLETHQNLLALRHSPAPAQLDTDIDDLPF